MTFTNSILAGTTLVREAISSEGFVSGSTGWEIQRDGDAEFNNVDIRGDWTIQGTDPDDFITGRVVTGIPRIEFARDGVTYAMVALSDAQFGERLSIGSLTGATPDISFMETPDNYIVFGPAVHPGPITLWDGGFFHAGKSVAGSGFVKENWVNVTVNSGTAVVGNEPQVKLLPDGTCIMRGVVTGHSTAVNTTVLTLPVGYRPARSGRYACSAEGTDDTHHMFVNTNGTISVARVGSGGTSGDNDTWFNNIHFSTI
jgi:hypothetical protein